jgi:hypothetical protein
MRLHCLQYEQTEPAGGLLVCLVAVCMGTAHARTTASRPKSHCRRVLPAHLAPVLGGTEDPCTLMQGCTSGR